MSGHYYTAHPAKIDFLFEGNLIIIRAMGQQTLSLDYKILAYKNVSLYINRHMEGVVMYTKHTM